MSDPNNYRTAAPTYAGADASQELIASFLRRVYGWMFVGLVATSLTAWQVASSPAAVTFLRSNSILFFALLFAELGLVVWMSARVGKLAPTTTAALFLLYSVLNGATLSFILLIYTAASIETTFITSAAMFGALALFGTLTGKNLQGLGHFAMMGLFGVLAAMVVGFFWHSDALQFIISIVGVIVFTALTAYDAQKLKSMALALEGKESGGYAVTGALALYLDFVNLFLFLLRFFGRRQ